MENEYKMNLKDILKGAFESGFVNAARSFSQMTNENVCCDNFKYCSVRLGNENFASDISDKYNLLLTTSIFGDVTGKSYLLLSDEEFNVLTKSIPGSHTASSDLKEEFIKELDNILSASVITKLSNRLDKKMYGDVPILISDIKASIEDVIYDDFGEYADDVCVNMVNFSFENHPSIRPAFVWVIDSITFNEKKIIID